MSMIVVHYYLQDEDKKELYLFQFEIEPNREAIVNDIFENFPVEGKFHFRFRVEDEENNQQILWLDSSDTYAPIPTFRGKIICKALQLPPFSNKNLIKAPKKFYQTEFTLQNPPQKPRQAPSNPIHTTKPSPSKVHTHSNSDFSPEPVIRQKNPGMNDLLDFPQMERKLSNDRSHSQSEYRHVKQDTPTYTMPPVSVNIKEAIKKRNEDHMKEKIKERTNKARSDWNKEACLQNDKMTAAAMYGDALSNWEIQNHQKRDIRALLMTLHTVLWPNSGWIEMGAGDLLRKSDVKRAYMKCCLIVHPDKVQTETPDIIYRAERIFAALNRAYKDLKE